MSTNARAIVTAGAQVVGAIGVGQVLDGDNANTGLIFLNYMMGQLGLQPNAIPVRVREVFDMTAGTGTPALPYTVGTGGTINTSRPNRLAGAGLILTNSQPNPVEIPLTLLTDDGYEGIQVKELSNNQPTCVWYSPTSPLGKLYLWPVPDTADNDLALYFNKPLTTFADLTTTYDLPPGCEEMLVYNFARRGCTIWQRPCPQDVALLAMTSLATYKRGNMRFNDLPQDIVTGNRQYGYNIMTGTGAGS